MRKVIAGVAGCLGVISSILAIIDALPQYNDVLLALIGVTVGYTLGVFTPDNETKGKMNEHSKGVLLVIIMFIVPPFIILFGIVVIWLIGFMTELLLQYILGWSIAILALSYIVAGVVSSSWAEKLSINNEVHNKKPHNEQSDNHSG
ncbi:MAG: hypothetical protein ACM3TR_09730 [Caulobacteraceae bacterium]